MLKGIQSTVAITVLAVLGFVNQASAGQIYKCTDDTGRKVFQQAPCKVKEITGKTPAHKLWFEMRELVEKAKKINSSIGPGLSAIKQCNNDVKSLSLDIAALEERLTAVQYKHKNLRKAHTQLQSCARCSIAAGSDCKSASKYLEHAMAKLTN